MPQENYVLMLEESLEKKIDILRQLQLLSEQQTEILSDYESTPEAFEQTVEKKAQLIEKLEMLDAGFETVFARVEKELTAHKEENRDAVLRMKDKIREITDRSSRLQVTEQHNREIAEGRFANIRTQARELRQSGKAVSTYYQNMMKVNAIGPQFMDSKK